MRAKHSMNPSDEERGDVFPAGNGCGMCFGEKFFLNRRADNRGGIPMQQRKFTSWCFAFIVVVCVMFASSQVMAIPTICDVANNGYIISIDNDAGTFPLVITDNTLDTNNYCDNTSMDNYPCSVFRYKIKLGGAPAPAYNHLQYTIPFCLNDQIKVLNSSPALNSLCLYGTPTGEKCGIQVGRFNALNSNSVTNTERPLFSIAVKGDVGLGVNSLYVLNSPEFPVIHPCSSLGPDGQVLGGIVGPSCYVPPPPEPNCYPPSFTSQTSSHCLSDVAGRVLKVDVDRRAITAVYECPVTDTDCLKPTCDPIFGGSPCNPAQNCVQKPTYEVEVQFYDANGNPLFNNHPFQIRHVGGSTEEAIGFFVVSNGDPTIYCLSGVGGNTVCACSGSNCPQ